MRFGAMCKSRLGVLDLLSGRHTTQNSVRRPSLHYNEASLLHIQCPA